MLRVIKQVNINRKKIGKELETATPVTTHVARHTYAAVLKRRGVSTFIISDALEHESESITQTYLRNFIISLHGFFKTFQRNCFGCMFQKSCDSFKRF